MAADRLTAIPAMLLTGRPYGLWRDMIFRRTGALDFGPIARTQTDTLAFLTFQVPVYAAILLFAGASPLQILAAISSALILMILLGRPYGIYLDACRRLAGIHRVP